MSTTNQDVVAAAKTVSCTNCATSVPKPADAQWAPLWDKGWRWLGTLKLFSCPDCPPLLIVDEQGRHVRGPGLPHVSA
ncbi:hypothetical protein ACWGH2_42055 [Streptomyces sp. NPDC054871]